MYTLQYFRDKFAAIPEDKWITAKLHLGEASCAFGHCGGYATEEAMALKKLTNSRLNEQYPMVSQSNINELPEVAMMAYVNDDVFCNRFPQFMASSPKHRVLNAIDTLIAEEKLVKTAQNIANTPKINELCIA